MVTSDRNYSCDSAAETLEWMNAIADFLRPYKPLIDSHVVNFFKDRLWELVDEMWIECLRNESVENLLGIPCGLIQDYWPASLQEFILTLRSLALPREQKSFPKMLANLHVVSLGAVLSQGMNSKKKHEVEILAAVVNSIAHDADAQTIIDVGSGQGYLAQTLSFEYQLSVIAIDASLHHSTVTAARAERIKKHYVAKLRKSGNGCAYLFICLFYIYFILIILSFIPIGNLHLKVPQVITCHVLSSDTLIDLSTSSYKDDTEQVDSCGSSKLQRKGRSSYEKQNVSSLVLAGLHACGDLSVSMLRTFVDCEQVKALVGIGCCYNLLSEESFENDNTPCGFPMSNAPKLSSFNLGKNARDLACQSAERWRRLTKDAALQNFELHAFRAAFQMVIDKYYPSLITSSPTIGRQGKALRRQQLRRSIESQLCPGGNIIPASNSKDEYMINVTSTAMNFSKDDNSSSSLESKIHYDMESKEARSVQRPNTYVLFKKFCELGLSRLSLRHLQDIDMLEIWREAQPFTELVGPYWSLRAALGQLVETYILLDRLLFLQEKGNSVQACLFPIFNPNVSPRNIAIIAQKTGIGS